MKSTLVIITWNQIEKLKKCLLSLHECCALNEVELIIIDNASEDGTGEFLKSYYSQHKIILNKYNNGVAKARNQGIKIARGETIILLDDDTHITSDFIIEGLRFLESNPEVGIMGPRLLFENNKVQPSARAFPTVKGILGRAFPNLVPDKIKEQYYLKYINANSPIQVDWVIGACQFIRKKVFDKIGLLDENYFFGYEDIDFCFRAHLVDYVTIYNPNISVIHYYQRKSTNYFSIMAYYHFRSIIRYFIKHGFKF